MDTDTLRTRTAAKGFWPEGIAVEELSFEDQIVTVNARTSTKYAACPLCRHPSSRIHSRYTRTVADLPRHGVTVSLRGQARRFFCENPRCERSIFCERLPKIESHARKTDRLEEALLLIAFELGGEAGARLACDLGLLVSPDTLLDRIQHAFCSEAGEVRVLGVDDFAFKRGHSYGTILVDLECHKVVDLLPERSQESLVAWLTKHPEIP